ncbi:hypothetical protein DFH06DRAFT_1318827 [Mycena polygramma]|nr:hypothetical protein DFH06DRAFT_1318827 [Mycena polygramma]
MQFLAVLLAAASVAFAQKTLPVVSSFTEANCTGTASATFTGVPENAFCQATPGANSLDITPGNSKCQIDIFTTSNCNGVDGGVIATVPLTDSCYTATESFESVRILCITTG